MKLYKKYQKDKKSQQYQLLAKEYLLLNNIKCKYYGWIGMSGNFDIIKTDKGIFRFNINTKGVV